MAEGATVIGRVAVKVIPDTTGFRSQVKRDLEKIEKSLNKIEVKLDLDGVTKRRVEAEVKALTRKRNLRIAPELDDKAVAKVGATLAALSGGRALYDMGTDFGDWIGELDRAVPKIAASALAITNISSAALAGTSNLLAFGSSLASVGGAGLALPGILGGVAIGAGATLAVLKDFNTVLPEVAGKFHDLQDSMSEKFWAKAKAPIREFINEIFPQFQSGIEGTSTALGGFFARLANSAKGQFDGELASMFDDLNKSIRIAGHYTDDFVGIIEKLGSVGAGNLPRLAKWFGDISDQFDGWLDAKGTNGLQQYVDTGIDALKDLGNVLRYTGSTLAGLGKAAEAAGGGSLGGLADVLERVSRTVNAADFQRNLTGTFWAAHEAMDSIVKQSGPEFRSLILRVSHLLTNVLPKAGKTAGKALGGIFDALDSPKVEGAIEGAFDNIDKAVDNLLPSLPKVADALAGVVDVIGALTVNVSRALGPALDTLAPAITDLSADIQPLITQLGDLLVNAVQGASPVVKDLASVLGDLSGVLAVVLEPINGLLDAAQHLPDPIKSAGSSLAVAAIAVWGFNAAVGGAQTKLAGLNTNLLTTQGRAKVFGSVMKNAAGIGGMLAFTQASKSAGDGTSYLWSMAGAALVGFQAGGPWGAALGAGAAALFNFQDAGNDTIGMQERLKVSMQDVIQTLNQQTGAFTQATRAKVVGKLEDAGLLASADTLGLSLKKLTSITMEGEGAIDQWRSKMLARTNTDAEATAVASLAEGMKSLNGELFEGQSAFARQREAMGKNVGDYQRVRDTVQRLSQDYDLLPHEVRTIFSAVKLEPTMENVRKLAKQYDTTPKTIKTLIGVIGADTTLKSIGVTKKKLKELGATKADLSAFKQGINTDLSAVQKIASQKARGVVKDIEQELAKGKADMPKLNPSLRSLMSGAATTASSAAPPVGVNLKQGIINGFAGTEATLVAQARAAVLAAVAAAKKAGDIHSPSRKMMEIGDFLGRGLALGLERRKSDVAHAARRSVEDIVKYAAHVLTLVQKATGKSHAKLEAQVDHLNSKLKDKDLLKHLAQVNKAYESQWNQLDKGITKLRNLRTEAANYQQSVMDSIIATGDPTQDGAITFDAIRSVMDAARTGAVKFAATMAQLKGKLNKDTFAQIVAAGPEAGLATAQAILASGKDGIAALNDIQKDILDAGKSLGLTASSAVFGSQIKQAAKDVRDLEKQLKPLEDKLGKLVKQLMARLAAEVKKGNQKVNKELRNFGSGADQPTTHPKSASPGSARRAGTAGNSGDSSGNTFIYNAAPGPSLSSEEALFGAVKRGRFPK